MNAGIPYRRLRDLFAVLEAEILCLMSTKAVILGCWSLVVLLFIVTFQVFCNVLFADEALHPE